VHNWSTVANKSYSNSY